MNKQLYILSFALLAAACGGQNKPVNLSAQKEGQQTKSGYEIGQVTEKSLASSVRLPGQLKPFNEVNIFAKVNSFVNQIFVDRGSIVEKGQLMVVLEAPEMLSQLQSANSRYIQANEAANASREKYRRLKEASLEEGAVSPLDLDNALSKMKGDEAVAMSEKSNVEAMKMVQSYLSIHAPFSGMVVQRNVSSGALVGPGKSNEQPMFILQDIAKLRLEVHIPENYVDKVDLSKPVSYIFNSQPGKRYQGKISRSANMLGSTQSEAIEIDVINTDQRLKPGMYCEVSIPLLSGASSLLVPNHSVVRSTERQYIVKVTDQKAIFVDVKEGIAANDSVEVFGNLKANDRILLHANDEVKEGSTVE
ncbi:efflux RND transporter periplasmic adaptor subunit [Olivibacter domesticus]|uniref:RND family efflux transporter, MFP subunit n=1 Tax=Olivibacter domesticus TaxID=407022 RepID=A0A1H7GVI4_OLID1|nr:efflux RND transporter periplasmic adaptor subunit [Olivibacter domesticus]SEK42009.1 RND family efflux transporter, MFP subunit [Olivibacter domesticus]